MASYSQSAVNSRTASTILPGVIVFPDGVLRGAFWPDRRTLSLVPPMSMARMVFGGRGMVATFASDTVAAWRQRRSRVLQVKHGDLRPHVETDATQVAESSINVEPAAVGEVEFPGRVARVSHRKQRWREKRRLTLPAVRVARQNPTPVTRPDRAVHRVRVVTEHQRRLVGRYVRQHAFRMKARTPEVIHAHD